MSHKGLRPPGISGAGDVLDFAPKLGLVIRVRATALQAPVLLRQAIKPLEPALSPDGGLRPVSLIGVDHGAKIIGGVAGQLCGGAPEAVQILSSGAVPDR